MPRRRQSAASRTVSFEVVEDLDDDFPVPADRAGRAEAAGSDESAAAAGGGSGADGSHDDPGAVAPGAGGAPSGRKRWRPVAAVAGVLALVAGGLAVGGQIEEQRTQERLLASEGGVLPFTGPPQEIWSRDLADQVWTPWGGLLLRRDASGTDETVTAVDVLTGQDVWEATVGTQAICGRNSLWQAFAVDEGPLLCLSGTPEVMTVTALDPDGRTTGRRDLGAVDEASVYAVGPGSTVVTVRRDGPVGPPVGRREVWSENGSPTFVDVPGGRGVVVTLEDALSGDVLWENRVPFVAPDEAWECQGRGDGTEPVLMLDQVTAWTTGHVVQVDGCGVSASFDAGGDRLDDPAAPDDQVEPLTATTTARFDQTTTRTTVLDRTGAPSWEVTGQILRPSATDGTGESTVFVDTLSGLAAFTPEGEELWDVSTYASTLFVHTAAVIVVDDGANGVTALDPTTGRRLWTVPGEDSIYPSGAATDGSQVVVPGFGSDGAARSTGYDLATGDVLWTAESTANEGLIGYGAMLRLTQDSVSRVG
ncbi:PQQ-binding-like beta-propeller repeat protein [Oerskovia sp. KBS0722]|uniref:outer membrane protein assembly factor BamB family protein n=1 Tax=Oerskovia sp. KBS0722 TaxID=1179673 RepID=UPI00110E4FF6|nr:PQQ-binding-like beta-propeller repeat protein [Oerskovia sp. KBS0722]QDW61147.1 PQQ-binding-like beta-propeller repeat protein [Oerskovia sp. KBS0722]